MIADFNRGEKPNLISGDFGSWNKEEWDWSTYCNESFTSDPNIVYGKKGCSLQLDYNVDSKGDSTYNGFWMRLEKINLNKYDEFVFFVKGASSTGYTTRFQVELKSITEEKARYIVSGITDKWQKVILPLDKAKKDGNFSEAYEFSILFSEDLATDKEGRIYIDQFYVK